VLTPFSHNMEPPAKRMRSLLSIEVDEENPEYIHAKKKQQEKFKGRLESIFEKYGNMNESMSDEIDMKTNTLAVDRGHLRRLGRKVHRKEEMMLLDTLGLAAGNEAKDESEEGEDSEDLEDELAEETR
jgi:Skp family chaperone for outer membrane proteins